MSCDPGHQRLTLRIKNAALEQKLAMLLGARPKAPLEFEAVTDLNDPHVRSLVRLVLFLGRATRCDIGTIAGIGAPGTGTGDHRTCADCKPAHVSLAAGSTGLRRRAQ